jgi:hypothetical protein
MHTLACATSTFFAPALAAGLRLLTIDKFLAQLLHTVAILYACKTGCGQIKFISCIIY